MSPKTTVCSFFPHQTASVAYFQRKIQLSGIFAYPDGWPSQVIRISGVLKWLGRRVIYGTMSGGEGNKWGRWGGAMHGTSVWGLGLATVGVSDVGFNLLKPTGYVTHHQFNIQQLYALSTLYLCVLYLSEHKQRLVPLTAWTDWFL